MAIRFPLPGSWAPGQLASTWCREPAQPGVSEQASGGGTLSCQPWTSLWAQPSGSSPPCLTHQDFVHRELSGPLSSTGLWERQCLELAQVTSGQLAFEAWLLHLPGEHLLGVCCVLLLGQSKPSWSQKVAGKQKSGYDYFWM